MTGADLYEAVVELTTPPRSAVATGDEIRAWLARHPHIDPGEGITPVNKHWWEADHANAPSKLRKFKVQSKAWKVGSNSPPCDQARRYASELNEKAETRQKLIDRNLDFKKCEKFDWRVDCYKLCPDIDSDTNEMRSTSVSWRMGC